MVGLLSHARHNWAPKAQILNELDDLLLVSLRPPEVRIPKNLPRYVRMIQEQRHFELTYPQISHLDSSDNARKCLRGGLQGWNSTPRRGHLPFLRHERNYPIIINTGDDLGHVSYQKNGVDNTDPNCRGIIALV